MEVHSCIFGELISLKSLYCEYEYLLAGICFHTVFIPSFLVEWFVHLMKILKHNPRWHA